MTAPEGAVPGPTQPTLEHELGERSPTRQHLAVFACLVISLLLIYASTVESYYPLLDDNWILQAYRSAEWRQFTRDTVAISQGRPLFAAMIVGTGFAAANLGVATMGVVRLIAIFALAAAAFLIYRWFVSWRMPATQAALFAFTVVTLPAFQLYVAAGPWLSIALVMSVLAAHCINKSCNAHSRLSRVRWNTAAVCLVAGSLTVYQATAMILFALLMWPALVVDVDSARLPFVRHRVVLTGLILTLSVTFCYFLLWRTATTLYLVSAATERYSPQAIHVSTFLKNIPVFRQRVYGIAKLWSVLPDGPSPYWLLTLALVGLAVFADVVKGLRRQSLLMVSMSIFTKCLLCAVLIALTDLTVLLSPKTVASYYMTSSALTLGIASVMLWSVMSVSSLFGLRASEMATLAILSIGALFGAFTAQHMVAQYFSVPLSLEYRLVRNDIGRYVRGHGRICGIKFIQNRAPLLGLGFGEFSWSNINSGFYATRLVENILDELKLPRVDVEIVIPWTGDSERYETIPRPPGCSPLVVDVSDMSLRNDSVPLVASGAGVSRIRSQRVADFDGDGRTDIAVYRRAIGQWVYLTSASNYATAVAIAFGVDADIVTPGDYDGDGKTDAAIFRPSTGTWWVERSSDRTTVQMTGGMPGDIPVPGDYDGDGKTDFAVYRPSTGAFRFVNSRTGGSTWQDTSLGSAGDVPVPADYDGDGRTDLAVYRPSTGRWVILTSSSDFQLRQEYALGLSADLPVPGDYDGDGRSDPAVYRPSNGAWHILKSTDANAAPLVVDSGVPNGIPAPGDFDGDGLMDVAVYRPTSGAWSILKSSSNFSVSITASLGGGSDVPICGCR
jgi:hypothetical protein